jgi:hypothetical protein
MMRRSNARTVFRRPLPPVHPEDEEFYRKAQAHARNRMQVFDVAPRHIRDIENYCSVEDEGRELRRWWGRQNEWDFNQYGELVPAHKIGWF